MPDTDPAAVLAAAASFETTGDPAVDTGRLAGLAAYVLATPTPENLEALLTVVNRVVTTMNMAETAAAAVSAVKTVRPLVDEGDARYVIGKVARADLPAYLQRLYRLVCPLAVLNMGRPPAAPRVPAWRSKLIPINH